MSKVSVTKTKLDYLANCISSKSGENVPLTLDEMADAVNGIQTGGTPTLQTITKSYTPTESQQTETITASAGYDGIEEVDVTVGAISSSYVGSGITRRSSSDLTASGATVTVPSGYYSEQASKAVASGTAGTPSASKGAVSNHSVSVTPSVTNTTGWITGSTKTGTAVTVSASELVSGNLAITENGTGIDVSTYSTVSVAVGGGQTTEIIVPEQTITASQQYTRITNYTKAIELGETYIITINGTPITTTAIDYWGSYAVLWTSDLLVEWVVNNSEMYFSLSGASYYGTYTVKVEHVTGGGGSTLITKTITANGTYDAEDDNADGYSQVTVSLPTMTLPSSASSTSSGTSKATITPTSSAQYLNIPTGYNGTAQYYTIAAGGGGTSKNVQVLQSTSRTNSSSLTKVLGDLTVSKTGTYDVYWSGGRTNTSTSYTWGTRLYVDGTGYGTENTTWSNNCQSNHLSNVSLTANQKLSVYTRGRSGSYYTFAPMLVIVEA